MPWNVEDVDRFCKGLSGAQKRLWVKIANAMLKDGADEGIAIATASKRAKAATGK